MAPSGILPSGYRTLGSTGLVVSELGIGASTFGRSGMKATSAKQVSEIVEAALELGVTYFDLAELYGDRPGLSEELFAAALRGRRDEVVIGTKFGGALGGALGASFATGGSRKYIVRAAEHALRRLGTDYIDLYQIHFPDPLTPIEETLSALSDLVTAGKVRYVGASNFPAWTLVDADHKARANGWSRFASTTDEYNLLWRRPEQELIPALQHIGAGFIPYFPLQNGLLTGKYSRDSAPEGAKITNLKRHLLKEAPWDALERFVAFADARGVSPASVALGWLLAQPAVATVIAGVTGPEQVRANHAAAQWRPTLDEEAELRSLFEGDLSGGPGKVTAD